MIVNYWGVKTKILTLLVLSFLIMTPGLLKPTTATAAIPNQGINLQISPLPILLSTEPGHSVSTDLQVRNAGTETEKLKVTLRKFKASNNDGTVTIDDRSTTDSYFDWVSFSSPLFDAPPGEWKTIKMNITPPKDAAFGYYYAVQFSRAAPPVVQPGQNAVEGAVAVFVLLDVKQQGAKRVGEVVEFSTSKRIYEFLPATFTVKLKNSGNTHLAAVGNIFISNGLAKLDQPIQINGAHGSILPGSIRIFKADWDSGFPVYINKTVDGQPVLDKNQQNIRTLKWDFNQVSKLRFGKYTARLVMVYDDGQRDVPIEAVVNFWVVPWRIIGGVLLGLLFIGIGMVTIGRKLWRRLKRR